MRAAALIVRAALALAAACSVAQPGARPADPTLAITHTTVIDATGAPPLPDMTILVEGRRIARIGPSASLRVPAGSRVVDATGTFAIPGLADMHVHLVALGGEKGLARMAASGIATVRDMAAPIDDILRLRALANRPGSGLPRVVAAGPKLEGPLPFRHPLVRSVASPEEARRAVADLAARGVDFIKIGDTLSPAAHAAIADEAGRRGLPFAGHLPAFVGAREASRAGQRTIDHFGSASLHGVLIACSTDEAALRAMVEKLVADVMSGKLSPDVIEPTLLRADVVDRLVDSYSADKASALFSAFARDATWQVPTLVAIQSVWDGMRGDMTREDIAAGARLRHKYDEMIAAMRRASVGILAGTDVPWPDDRTSAPIHDELVLLVKAGMTPMEALQSATRNAAEVLGTLRSEGTIEAGKTANVVLLEASPLEDISNTRRIRAVLLGGRLLDLPGRKP
ncbi:MAG TPA: amidohydrolase family protein [Kofleriaceae bacterium]|nr:amidohydrolase family protein [Kofleriaceae bacterium]